MNCDDARELMFDALTASSAPTDDADLRAHLTTCEACRAEQTEYRALWEELGTLPPARPVAGAEQRFRARFSEIHGAARDGRRWRARHIASLAAMLIIGMTGGLLLAPHRALTGANSTTTVAGAQYLLLLHEGANFHSGATSAEMAGLVAEYGSWARSLRSAGILVSAEELAEAPPEWLGPPVPQNGGDRGDRVSGFFVIRASSYDEARRIARECPHLRHGGTVELRAIQPT